MNGHFDVCAGINIDPFIAKARELAESLHEVISEADVTVRKDDLMHPLLGKPIYTFVLRHEGVEATIIFGCFFYRFEVEL